MEKLVADDIVCFNRNAKCGNVAMVVAKGRGYREVADHKTANAQVECLPWPMPDLEANCHVSGAFLHSAPWICCRTTDRCRWYTTAQECFCFYATIRTFHARQGPTGDGNKWH